MRTEAHYNKLIKDVSHLIDNEIDAEGNPLTNETEMLLRKELGRLYSAKREIFGRI